jgi:hypothetical protein
MYEPYVHALSAYFRLRIPPWIAQADWVDHWQASTWEPSALRKKEAENAKREHF